MLKTNLLLIISLLGVSNLIAQEPAKIKDYQNFYVKPYVGFIGIRNMDLQLEKNNQSTAVAVEAGFGFTTGISFGYRITNGFSAEVGWEYKRNMVNVTYDNNRSNGDYASNFIYLNGFYNFNTENRFKPYLGIGASIIQEIDLDFGQGENNSFSTSGNIGFQGIAGLDFNFSRRWALNWEAKYVAFRDFNMTNEISNNVLKNLTYNPFIFNIGVKYRF